MKSVIAALCTTAFLVIASTASASPATDIDHIRGIFSANFPDGVKTVEESTSEEEPWGATTLKFEYGGKPYSLSLSYTEGMEYLDTEVRYHGVTYHVTDEGIDLSADVTGNSNPERVDGVPDKIYDENLQEISPAPQVKKELIGQYKDALLALAKYYSSNKVSKN